MIKRFHKNEVGDDLFHLAMYSQKLNACIEKLND